jgi:hypothetical protein
MEARIAALRAEFAAEEEVTARTVKQNRQRLRSVEDERAAMGRSRGIAAPLGGTRSRTKN